MTTILPLPIRRFAVPTAKPLFESKPRWLGAPKICLAANLPAFETEKEMTGFLNANSPGTSIIKKWKCTVCNHYHAWPVHSGPSGASSGTTRVSKAFDTILEKLMNSPLAKTMPVTE